MSWRLIVRPDPVYPERPPLLTARLSGSDSVDEVASVVGRRLLGRRFDAYFAPP